MYDVIIVGAGTAGLTAALYAARASLNALVLEKVFPGGQIARAHIVENYPGFPEGLTGVELSMRLKEQAERHGAVIKTENVTGFDLEGDVKKITTSEGTYEAKTVLLAMGANYREIGLPSEKKLVGSGVSYCATCDGAFFKGQDVAVIGGGDTALEDAIYLDKFVNKVYVVHRRDEFRAQAALQEAAKACEKIEFVLSCVPESIEGKSKVEGLKIKSKKTGEVKELPVTGVFVAIGIIPESDAVKGKVCTDDFGYICTDQWMATSVKGVYAAGDIVLKPLKQVVTAAADGATAIYAIQAYLTEQAACKL